MRIENGQLVLGRKDCYCQDGTRPSKIACPACKGTGKGKRGGKGGCRPCYGMGHKWDHDNPVVCPACQGAYAGHEEETRYDSLPDSEWQALPFRVIRQNRGMTLNEQHLGAGTVYSCVDYGRSWATADDAIIAEARAHRSVQACKVTLDSGEVCREVVIQVTPGGYAVRANFSPSRADSAVLVANGSF